MTKTQKMWAWIAGLVVGGGTVAAVAYKATGGTAAPAGAGGNLPQTLVAGRSYRLVSTSAAPLAAGTAASVQAAFPASYPGMQGVQVIQSGNTLTMTFAYTGPSVTLQPFTGYTSTLTDMGPTPAGATSVAPSGASGVLPQPLVGGRSYKLTLIPTATSLLTSGAAFYVIGVLSAIPGIIVQNVTPDAAGTSLLGTFSYSGPGAVLPAVPGYTGTLTDAGATTLVALTHLNLAHIFAHP